MASVRSFVPPISRGLPRAATPIALGELPRQTGCGRSGSAVERHLPPIPDSRHPSMGPAAVPRNQAVAGGRADEGARCSAGNGHRQLPPVASAYCRPLAAVRDFLIGGLLCSRHRPFACARTKTDRRRNQSFACAPGRAPSNRQHSKKETASSRPKCAIPGRVHTESGGRCPRSSGGLALRRDMSRQVHRVV